MIGDYPADYNPKVHGPYDPARYYGKPDTPFGQVKLSELVSWFSRRDKHPRAAVAAISRAFWRWQHKYVLPRRSTIAPVLQFGVSAMIIFYAMNHFKIKNHKNYKYH
ncbi:ATP synthase, subunit F [Lycorma delicatula]|uniref:ATP synthase, subunit F n=1 Tax=Lycorma delicatula TaxID=130591 RepID=UPI003F518532